MTERRSAEVPLPCDDSPKKWSIPSFIVRDYQHGYERECTEYLFGGENKKGARDSVEDQLERVIHLSLKAA